MTLQPRDRRALALLAVAATVILAYRYMSSSPSPAVVAASSADPVLLAEKRLARLREAAATVPAKEAIVKQLAAELEAREKFLISGATAAQAQAHVIETVRNLAGSDNPPVEIRQTTLGPVRALNETYGEVVVSVQFECRIEQLVNLLSAIGSQPGMISTSDIRVVSAAAKDKTVGVQLTLSGLVPRKLIPEKTKQAGAAL